MTSPLYSNQPPLLPLRDQFAAKMMAALLSNAAITAANQPPDIAKYAIECADELIKQLNAN